MSQSFSVDQLKAIHAITDEKKRIYRETLKHTNKLDKWLSGDYIQDWVITTDESIQLAKDIKYMQDGNCDINFIATNLGYTPDEIRQSIRHTEEMKHNMAHQNK